jgi:hypothetical protein
MNSQSKNAEITTSKIHSLPKSDYATSLKVGLSSSPVNPEMVTNQMIRNIQRETDMKESEMDANALETKAVEKDSSVLNGGNSQY